MFVLDLKLWFKMASETAATSKPEGAAHGVNAVVPERIAKCLEESKDFGQYKLARKFRFLHMFSGPVDVLAQAVKTECEKEGITCVVESYDKLIDESHDMTLDQPYETILHKAKNQEYDGGHAGFPCGSFSRARLNAKGDGPGPVRSGLEIYGLETNNRRQQAEADR